MRPFRSIAPLPRRVAARAANPGYERVGLSEEEVATDLAPVTIVRTRKGAQLRQGGFVLSEILRKPGATGDLFDVIAACAAVLSTGPRNCVLGFGGGGIVAPLRAMGFTHRVEAVDLRSEGERVFRELSSDWGDPIRFVQAEALQWLAKRRGKFDLIVEDLFVHGESGPEKPDASLEALPKLMYNRLSSSGSVVINIAPRPSLSWQEQVTVLSRPFRRAALLRFEDYENRLLLMGDQLANATILSRRVRSSLRAIESTQASRITIETVRALSDGVDR